MFGSEFLNTRIREPVPCAVARSVPSLNVAAQMGLPTWQGGSVAYRHLTNTLDRPQRNNFHPIVAMVGFRLITRAIDY